MMKQREQEVCDLLARLCRGVTAYGADFELLPNYQSGRLSRYNIRVNEADIPRIVGRAGERFKSLQQITRQMARNAGLNIELEWTLPSIKGKPESFAKFQFNPRWPKDVIKKLMEDLCAALFVFPCSIEIREATKSAVLVVRADPRESMSVIDAMTPPIQNVFLGIGTTNGCKLSVDFSKET